MITTEQIQNAEGESDRMDNKLTALVEEMKRRLNCLQSETAKSMIMCECGKYFRLPSDKKCFLCQIAELKAQLAKHEWIIVDDAEENVKYQMFYEPELVVFGHKGLSGQWYNENGNVTVAPKLIKPIHLPEPKHIVDANKKVCEIKEVE